MTGAARLRREHLGINVCMNHRELEWSRIS